MAFVEDGKFTTEFTEGTERTIWREQGVLLGRGDAERLISSSLRRFTSASSQCSP
jgi:hypothetical protein